MKKGGIYKIWFDNPDEFYIGRSIDIKNRIRTHERRLIRGAHSNKNMQAGFNGSFNYEVVEYIDGIDNQIKAEDKHVRSGFYNLTLNTKGIKGKHKKSKTISQQFDEDWTNLMRNIDADIIVSLYEHWYRHEFRYVLSMKNLSRVFLSWGYGDKDWNGEKTHLCSCRKVANI